MGLKAQTHSLLIQRSELLREISLILNARSRDQMWTLINLRINVLFLYLVIPAGYDHHGASKKEKLN